MSTVRGYFQYRGHFGVKPCWLKAAIAFAWFVRSSLVLAKISCVPQAQLAACVPQAQLAACVPQAQLAGSRFGVGPDCAEMVKSAEEAEWTSEVSLDISGCPPTTSRSAARSNSGEGDLERPCPRDQVGGVFFPEALKKAQGQAQARPVGDSTVSTKVFIERAKKRVSGGREEVSCEQEALAQAQTQSQSEEQGLIDGGGTIDGTSYRKSRPTSDNANGLGICQVPFSTWCPFTLFSWVERCTGWDKIFHSRTEVHQSLHQGWRH